MIDSTRMCGALACAALVLASAGHAAPIVQRQQLHWFVVNGIGAGGDPLAAFTAVIDQANADAKRLLQGTQGPGDAACCVDLERASITSIDAPGLQAVDSELDYDAMTALCDGAGGGSCAFLVDSITYCGGFSPTTIGCADTPLCSQNPAGDDPAITLVVSLDALEDGSLAQTLAHERGHNACLEHVPWSENPTTAACALMQAAAGGGCLNAAECSHYRDAANGVGDACGCHDDALAPIDDGSACTDGVAGVCSGGVCGESGSDAGLVLLTAGGTASLGDTSADERIAVSALTGGWSALGATTGGVAITGLEHAASRGVTYAVTASDQLLRVDPRTGATLATVGALAGTGSFSQPASASSAARYDSLAFDPGLDAGPADDRLLAVRVSESCTGDPIGCAGGFCSGELVAIDPDTAATQLLGGVDYSFCGGFPGLAFDAVRRRLYASVAAGVSLYEIDLGCPSQLCAAAEVLYGTSDTDPAHLREQQMLARFRPTLAYGAATDRLYRLGSDGNRQLYDVFDAETLAHGEPIGVADFTSEALAAPEPLAALRTAAALASLAALTRRRPR